MADATPGAWAPLSPADLANPDVLQNLLTAGAHALEVLRREKRTAKTARFPFTGHAGSGVHFRARLLDCRPGETEPRIEVAGYGGAGLSDPLVVSMPGRWAVIDAGQAAAPSEPTQGEPVAELAAGDRAEGEALEAVGANEPKSERPASRGASVGGDPLSVLTAAPSNVRHLRSLVRAWLKAIPADGSAFNETESPAAAERRSVAREHIERAADDVMADVLALVAAVEAQPTVEPLRAGPSAISTGHVEAMARCGSAIAADACNLVEALRLALDVEDAGPKVRAMLHCLIPTAARMGWMADKVAEAGSQWASSRCADPQLWLARTNEQGEFLQRMQGGAQ